ncbi:MAG: hypothetical protein RI958_1179 [Actinomycetota bacterium]|jgi:hypothetical protein
MSVRSGVGFAVALLVLLGPLASCSDPDPESTSDVVGSSDPFAPMVCAEADPVLLVDQIDRAVVAVEAELGGAQRYYEINATAAVVNLFVAGENGRVTPFAFAADALTSQDPAEGATGNTFAADSMRFDPMRVTSCVADELTSSTQEVFIVLGGPSNAVRYSVLTRSTAGGQLLIDVDAEGAVLGVEPV